MWSNVARNESLLMVQRKLELLFVTQSRFKGVNFSSIPSLVTIII